MAEQHRGQREHRIDPGRGAGAPSAPDPGRTTLVMQLPPVQLSAAGAPTATDAHDTHALAAHGVSGGATALPHLPQIQRAFGRHDVAAIDAHVGGPAAEATHALGAEAYATGSSVAFREQPSLFTAAHEAAHVVQQRAGVQLQGGVGAPGDAYEQHADAVADRVVRGESAEALLDGMAGHSAHSGVQARPAQRTTHNPHGEALAARMVAANRSLQLRAVQFTRSNGVSLSNMKFAPAELPADGTATSQATVAYSARVSGTATIDWSIVGATFGSTVDAAGKITAGGAIPAGSDKKQIEVKAIDHKEAGAFTSARLTLWDPKFLEAKADYPKFIAANYALADHVAGTGWGKFDVNYAPRAHRLTVSSRLAFNFVDDGATKWKPAQKRTYVSTMISKVQSAWSGQWQFQNIREPKSIWSKLNPVSVQVKVKEDAAAPHYTVTVHKAPTRAVVSYVTPTADFGPDVNKTKKNEFPGTAADELAQLTAQIPPTVLFAAPDAVIAGGDQAKLVFLGRYLHSIRSPRFKLDIAGHVKQDPTAVTAADKRRAAAAAQRLSVQRAAAVKAAIAAAGVSQHTLHTTGTGDVGMGSTAADDRVDIAAAVRPGFVNTQTTSVHEFGHMLGLGDEYPEGARVKGDNDDHYDIVKAALGQDYADAFGKVNVDSEGLMNGGKDIRPQHYVTMWEGLAAATAASAQPTTPFGQADWKFVGV